MLNLFASALFDSRSAAIKASGGSLLPTQPLEPELVEAVRAVMARCVGGYAVVTTVGGYGLVCWRDPNGIRPLSYGRRKMDIGDGFEYMVVSESGAHPPSAHAVLSMHMLTWHAPWQPPGDPSRPLTPPHRPLAGTLTGLGFELVGDVPPGAALLLPRDGSPPRMHNCLSSTIEKPLHAPCVFEYVYFARPDSVRDGPHLHDSPVPPRAARATPCRTPCRPSRPPRQVLPLAPPRTPSHPPSPPTPPLNPSTNPYQVLDGVSVYRARLRMGEKLAHNILRSWPDHDIDVVIPIPDTSRTSALECAATLGIKYREGFIKNRYVGRTFIMPDQGLRKKTVRHTRSTPHQPSPAPVTPHQPRATPYQPHTPSHTLSSLTPPSHPLTPPLPCPHRCVRSCRPSARSSSTATCCSSTTPSCAAPPPPRYEATLH